MKNKKYKALVLDIDGTTVEYDPNARPSKKVIKAVWKGHEKIKIILATSRPHWHAQNVINDLKIANLCVVMGGPQIYNPKTKTIIWEKLINAKDVVKIAEVALKLKIDFTDDGSGKPQRNEKINFNDYRKKGPPQFWFYALEEKLADKFIRSLSKIKNISALKMVSWKKGKKDVLICHVKATKKHGIKKAAKLLGIRASEMIGVGDGHNDLPLLEACGFKIAMGNATDDIKAIADYIAPSVKDDGVAHVIEKFILN